MVSSWFPVDFTTTAFLCLGTGFVLGLMIALLKDLF